MIDIRCIRWEGGTDEIRQAGEDAVAPNIKYLPFWIKGLAIRVSGETGEERDTIAEVTAQLEYREALLTIYPPFWVTEEVDRIECIRHEFMHLLLAPLSDWVYEYLIEPLKDDSDDIYEILEKQFWQKVETVTQDLTFLMEGR